MRIAYGTEATSYGDLRLPAEGGPFPVVVTIHGGCWLADRGSMDNYKPLAEELTGHGIATWNIEYRRVGHNGGGWPGTFNDLGAALDFLVELANDHPLDLDRVVAVGHSSGGHFASWLAARPNLPVDSEIRGIPRVPLAGLILTDALIDPRVIDSTGVDGSMFCGEPILERLMGAPIDDDGGRLQEISPLKWLPWGMPQTYVISSRRYPVTPKRPLADGRTTMEMPDYPELARAAGDQITVEVVDNADHFDFIEQPTSAGYETQRRAVLEAVAKLTAKT